MKLHRLKGQLLTKSKSPLANHLKSGCLVVSAIAGSLFAYPLSAADMDAKATEPKSQQSSNAYHSGSTIFVDPATGKIRAPTQAERNALQQKIDTEHKFSKSDDGLVQVQLPDGSYMVDLQGRFQHTLKIQSGADGSLTYQCDTQPEHSHVAKDSEE